MSVNKFIFESSPALVSEMAFLGQTDEGHKIYRTLKSRADIERFVESSSEYQDLQQFVQAVEPGRIADVGAGYGITSAYLAIKGFDVVAVEPSLRLCEDMDVFFRYHKLRIAVTNATAESMNSLGHDFDAVLFYSSLNHCFDAERALANARRLLVPWGKVFVCAPVLAFHRSKAWCEQLLKHNPRSRRHYNANERIYRFSEYTSLLKQAGFESVKTSPSLRYGTKPHRASWDSDAGYVMKRGYYAAMRMGFIKAKPIWSTLAKLSLLSTVWLATKPGKIYDNSKRHR